MAQITRKLAEAERGDLSEDVYRRIRELIVYGRLAPGARIVEAEMADQLGVSRGTVRPTLLRLQQEGYVTTAKPGRQSRLIVAPLTLRDALELYFLIGELEGLAVWWVAQAKVGFRANVAIRMDNYQSRLMDLPRDDPPTSFLKWDRAFHAAYVGVGGGRRLKAMHASLKPQLERYAILYAHTIDPMIDASADEHPAIVRAIREGDREGARRAVHANWQNGAESLGSVISAVGSRGVW